MPLESILNEIYLLLPDTETIIASAFVKVYTSDSINKKWMYTRLSGILLLIIDRNLSAFLFRLYDLSKLEMTFETELYYGFENHYKILSNKFHCFQIPGGQVGLNFAKDEQAEEFLKYIKLYSPQEPPASINPKLSKGKSSKWVKSLKAVFSMKKNDSKKQKVEISKPYAVQLVSRVEWDNERKEFILDSLPEELRKIFLMIGAEFVAPTSTELRHSLRLSVSSDLGRKDDFRKSAGISEILNNDLEKNKRKMQIKVYQSTPTESLSSNFGQIFQNSLKDSDASGSFPQKNLNKEGFDQIIEDTKREKLYPLIEENEKSKTSQKKQEKNDAQNKTYGQLYRDLLKKGVANRHKELNQYGNSEFSSESSTKK